MKLFTIYDTQCETYDPIITINSTGEAIRGIEIAVKTPDHRLCTYKNYFTLYEVGIFDQQTGKIEIYPEKKHLLNLSEIQ